MGFLVTHPSLQPDASTKLKVKPHPPTSRIVDLLEQTPPKTEDEAKTWFAILASRISGLAPVN